MGMPRLHGFVKALDALKRRDYQTSADEFADSRWYKQVGQRGGRIVEMIRTGTDSDDF
jgi:hypothetical protein